MVSNRQQILLDTGVLVAFLNDRDNHHQWATTALSNVQKPLLTCEAVISEACFLAQSYQSGKRAIFGLLRQGLIQIPFQLNPHLEEIAQLITRYETVPMSFADACLVRMAELYPNGTVLTLDSDFQIYRKRRNQPIPVIMPD